MEISIHALQAESDYITHYSKYRFYHFNPRSPSGERLYKDIDDRLFGNFNPRSPSGERLVYEKSEQYINQISIHALQAESDNSWTYLSHLLQISIHALQAESDMALLAHTLRMKKFQSTLSKRRATWVCYDCFTRFIISIHALQAESDYLHVYNLWNNKISIHALQAESDLGQKLPFDMYHIFQSTLSKRRATCKWNDISITINISIHALQAESDNTYFFIKLNTTKFQSTLSKRRATRLNIYLIVILIFQSTLSKRRATTRIFL